MCCNKNARHEFSIRFLRFFASQLVLMSDNHQPKAFCTENNFVPLDGRINRKVIYGLRCVFLNDAGTLLAAVIEIASFCRWHGCRNDRIQ